MTTEIEAAYAAANRPLTELIDTLTPQQWQSPSPCEGWSAADVVRHMIDTQRELFNRHEVELGESQDVAADPAAAWRTHTQAVLARLADERVGAMAFDGFFGPTTFADTLRTFYVHDMIAHRWDLAKAAGREIDFSEAELDALEAGHAAFGDAMYMDGIYKKREIPDNATRQERVLATMGRDPR